MDPRIIKAIIIFVCLVVVALQTAALADPAGYIKCKELPSETSRYGYTFIKGCEAIRARRTPWLQKCGIFTCDGGYSLREPNLGEKEYIEAACAFGVIAAVLMGISLILHVLQLFPKIVDKLVCVMKRYWIVHIFTAICCAISWSLLLAYYLKFTLEENFSLQHGFYFLIINMCFEFALAFVCFKRRHSDSPKSIEEESVPPQHPDHQSASPIEGEERALKAAPRATNPKITKIIKAIIIFVCLVVLALQIAALADPAGYIKCKTNTNNGCDGLRYSRPWALECGMFECNGSNNLREWDGGGYRTDRRAFIKAACAFGVIAAVLMGISLILHVLQLFPKIVDKLVCVMKRYWIVHIFTAICCAISWGLLMTYYLENNFNEWYYLQHGFYFQITNMCLELALAFVCFKRRHSDSPKSIEEESVPPQHPDHQSASPIEGECQ